MIDDQDPLPPSDVEDDPADVAEQKDTQKQPAPPPEKKVEEGAEQSP